MQQKIINYDKKEMIPLTKKEEQMHNKQNVSIYVKKDLVLMTKTKITSKSEAIAIILENTEVLLMISAI